MPKKSENVAYIIEYFDLLLDQSKVDQLIRIYRDLDEKFKQHERLCLIHAQAQVKNNHLDGIEQVFELEFAHIREGEKILTNLWYEYWGRKIALNLSEEYNESKHLDLAKKEHPIKQRINFNISG